MRAFVGFAGFGGVDLALRDFNFDVIGVEVDDKISEVNRMNGGNIITADILDIEPRNYIGYNLMHFSPPCPSFSIANYKSSETEEDVVLAKRIAQFVISSKPQYFTLENVGMYRKSQSWNIILEVLLGQGYGVNFWYLNSADYGIPQTRKRMIVIARRDRQKPIRPIATHWNYSEHKDQLSLFDMLPKWNGWFEAVRDLIPELPDNRFTEWEYGELLKVFGKQLFMKVLIINYYNHRELIIREGNWPIFTIVSKGIRPRMKMITGNQNQVVSITPCCLARFQDFPDWFKLPESKTLAYKGIGNAMPRGIYKAVLNSLKFVDQIVAG